MQNENEIKSVELKNFTDQQKVAPSKAINLTIKTQEPNIDNQLPVIIYTRSIENYRGEIISYHFDNLISTEQNLTF